MKRFLRRNAGLLGLVLAMAFMRTAVADWSYVPTGSMEPTIYAGDWLWVDKTEYGPSIPFTSFRLLSLAEPERGDVVTFYPPHEDALYVKRIVGLPGDRIAVRGESILVNGSALPWSETHALSNGTRIGAERLGGGEHRVQFSAAGQLPVLPGELVVPEGKYFVLGDHRNNSADSRYWGYVDERRIVGKVTHVAVSFSDERPLSSRFAIPVR